jgi:hypothetical protein
LFWGVCHSQAFIEPLDFNVFAQAHSSNNGVGAGLDTGIMLEGGPFAVTVNQNDLWNAGALPRWSNADGLIQQLIATGTDDSGQAPGTEIGIDWPTNHTEGTFTEDFGTLVGAVGANRFTLGTSFNSTPPAMGTLKLFYWDVNAGDNTEKVTVRVAEKSIQCETPNNNPAVATGIARGNLEVELVYNPELNVDNTSKNANHPTTIVGCADYDPSFVIQSNGSPIINGSVSNTKVFVNGKAVTLSGFSVADKISQPSCDSGQPLPDLKLDLNRLSLINAVAPGGACTNGLNSFKLEIGSDTNGWFAGTNTMTLSNCN